MHIEQYNRAMEMLTTAAGVDGYHVKFYLSNGHILVGPVYTPEEVSEAFDIVRMDVLSVDDKGIVGEPPGEITVVDVACIQAVALVE